MGKRHLFALTLLLVLVCCNGSANSDAGDSPARMESHPGIGDSPARMESHPGIGDSLSNPESGKDRCQDTLLVKRLEREIEEQSKILREYPANVDVLAKRGRNYLELKRIYEAQNDAFTILKIDSTHHGGLLLLGEVKYVQVKTREARDAWLKCIEEHPKETESRVKLAELYSVVKDYDKSFELVNQVIKLDPKNALAFYIKGLNIRDSKGDTALALVYIQKAIDVDNSLYPAIEMAGVLTAAMGNPIALGYYDRLIDINSQELPNCPELNAPVYYKIGKFHLDVKNYNEAIESFMTCTKLNPNDAEAYFNLGFIYLELQLLSDARVQFSKSIQSRKINFRAYYGRAYCWEIGGDLSNAEKDYRQALSMNPEHGPSKEGLARVLSSKEKNEG